MMPKSIKLFWLVSAVLLLAAAVVSASLTLAARPGPGDIYKTYAGRPDIEATFLRNYPLGDSIAVDVTILAATTDSAWAALRGDFGIAPIPKEALAFLGQDSDMTTFKRVPKADPSPAECGEVQDSLLLVVQEFRRMVCAFLIEDDRQLNAIIHNRFSKIEH